MSYWKRTMYWRPFQDRNDHTAGDAQLDIVLIVIITTNVLVCAVRDAGVGVLFVATAAVNKAAMSTTAVVGLVAFSHLRA